MDSLKILLENTIFVSFAHMIVDDWRGAQVYRLP